MSDSEVLDRNLPCPHCDSSDAYATYDDGHGYCFSCEAHDHNAVEVEDNKVMTKDTNTSLSRLPYNPIRDRKISEDTCRFYQVMSDDTKHIYPYTNQEDKWVFNKIRVVADKKFHAEGVSKGLKLFGQTLFPGRGKYITLVEGELDALSAYELMGSKWPVVSVKNAQGAKKDCKENYEWLDSFDEIVICFDADEPGQKASLEVAELFGNKSKIVKMDKKKKDASGYLIANDFKGFTKAWWDAKKFVLDGLVNAVDLKDRLKNRKEVKSIPGPWEELDKLTYGFRTGEMWTITAGSGMGKTQVLRELEHWFLSTTAWNIGGLFIEETPEDSAEGVMSIEAGAPLHLPDHTITEDEWDDAFNKTAGTGRLVYFDGFGENNIERIVNRIRFMAKSLDCKVIFLDHISIMVSEQNNGDERKTLDEIATKLKKITMELDILLIMVSHSKRQATKPHEEGGHTSLSDLRGTAAIGQLSNIVLGLERNGQDPDPDIRNTTLIRVLKNRFSGLTGPSSFLKYSGDTGRLTEITFNEKKEIDELGEDDGK